MPVDIEARRAKAKAVVDAAQDGTDAAPLICRHAAADSRLVGLCALHPGASFLCPRCAIEHNNRSPDHGRLCEVCDTLPAVESYLDQLPYSRPLLAQALDGGVVLLGLTELAEPRSVYLWSFAALCGPCAEANADALPPQPV